MRCIFKIPRTEFCPRRALRGSDWADRARIAAKLRTLTIFQPLAVILNCRRYSAKGGNNFSIGLSIIQFSGFFNLKRSRKDFSRLLRGALLDASIKQFTPLFDGAFRVDLFAERADHFTCLGIALGELPFERKNNFFEEHNECLLPIG